MNLLLEKYHNGLSYCNQKIANFNKFKCDYNALSQKLSTITDRTYQDIMMPIGGTDIAFIPAKIYHTNEILVLLGDNYFVERSAKQAMDIVKRRIDHCDHMLQQLEKEKTQFENWISFAQQYQQKGDDGTDLIEIHEEYDEEREKQWKEEHRIRVREYKQKMAAERIMNKAQIDEKLLQILEISDNDDDECDDDTVGAVNLKPILKSSDPKAAPFQFASIFSNANESIPIVNEPDPKPLKRVSFNVETDETKEFENVTPKIPEIISKPFINDIIERPVSGPIIESINNTISGVSRFKLSRSKK